MIKDDGQVLHFNNPKVQASLAANTFAITGHADNKRKCSFAKLLAIKELVSGSLTDSFLPLFYQKYQQPSAPIRLFYV